MSKLSATKVVEVKVDLKRPEFFTPTSLSAFSFLFVSEL
jgi:hypothetical protein